MEIGTHFFVSEGIMAFLLVIHRADFRTSGFPLRRNSRIETDNWFFVGPDVSSSNEPETE